MESKMADKLLDILLDAVVDCAKLIPFIFGVYLLIEYLEHHSTNKLARALGKMGPFGPVGGSVLGVVPQCGFSVVASNLYAGRLITVGTLISVYISTSDEAIPIIISEPRLIKKLWVLILIKVVTAIIAGLIVDTAVRLFHKENKEEPFKELCHDCDCEHHSILQSALHHTVQIVVFILIVNLLLGGFMEFAGEDTVKKILMTDSIFQPFIAAFIGFIPNCAASVVLTQLYVEGVLGFGSLVAGLCTGAGVGLLVLFRTNRHHLKQNFTIVGLLYVFAAASGLITRIFV